MGLFRLSLGLGRLSGTKNYESLIRAFAIVADRFPAWDLVIVGEGAGRLWLESVIRDTELSDRVFLPGATRAVSECYAGAHIYCLPSRHESFPNALLEAQSHGLPAVGFVECSGINELIRHGVDGLLAQGNGDAERLSECLASLMGDPDKRRRMGVSARDAAKRFCPDAVMRAWEVLFEECIRQDKSGKS